MGRDQEQSTVDYLREARRDFVEWRSGRKKGERIPQALWESAIAVAAALGVSRASTELRLDYYALKRHVEAVDPKSMRNAPKASAPSPRKTEARDDGTQFLELSLASEDSTVACALEVEKTFGDAGTTKLRLEFESVALADLNELVRSVWSNGR